MSVPRRKRLVLASGSPRRRALMAAFKPPVDRIAPAGEEGPQRHGETPEDFVQRLSLAKAQEVAERAAGSVVLGADTAVVFDGQVIGKPSGGPDATAILARLRGRTHRVVTGVTALDTESGHFHSSATCSDVAMRCYSDAEVDDYVRSGEPFDKAGAYAVQDPRFHPARNVTGCYLNVVGLPVCAVAMLLSRMGVEERIWPDWQPPSECTDCPLDDRGKVGVQ